MYNFGAEWWNQSKNEWSHKIDNFINAVTYQNIVCTYVVIFKQ